MKRVTLLFAWAALLAAEPRLFYSRSFPGSVPPYFEIQIERSGAGLYRESKDDDDAYRFQLTDNEAAVMFHLAEKVGRFTRQIESGLKVANTGVKTFRWENGSEKHEVKFNYTQDPDAAALLDWFERIAESQLLLGNLERTVQFDRLGVHKSLLQIEAAWNRKRLVGLDQFLPWLDRVRKNDSYLHMARERAAALADAFRNVKSADPPSAQQ
jgi:hypothetical protein